MSLNLSFSIAIQSKLAELLTSISYLQMLIYEGHSLSTIIHFQVILIVTEIYSVSKATTKCFTIHASHSCIVVYRTLFTLADRGEGGSLTPHFEILVYNLRALLVIFFQKWFLATLHSTISACLPKYLSFLLCVCLYTLYQLKI